MRGNLTQFRLLRKNGIFSAGKALDFTGQIRRVAPISPMRRGLKHPAIGLEASLDS